MATPTRGHTLSRLLDLMVHDRKVVFVESLVVFMLVWSVFSYGFGLRARITAPDLVAIHVYELLVTGRWFPHVFATFRRVVYSFFATLLFGTVVGMMMGLNRFFQVAWRNYIALGLALPSLFGGVFAAIWFGYSDLTPVAAAVAITFPYIAINLLEGVKDIDHDLYEMSGAFGVPREDVIRHVVIPAVSTSLFSGARYAFAYSWKIVNLAELIVAEEGIGFMIRTNLNLIDLTGVVSWVVLFVVGFLVIEYLVFRPIERHVFRWRRSASIAIM